MMIAGPIDLDARTPIVLSGALVDLALLPPCTSAADANLRIRAAMIAEGDRVSRLVLIASIAMQGIIAEEQEPPPGMPLFDEPEIIKLPNTQSRRKQFPVAPGGL